MLIGRCIAGQKCGLNDDFVGASIRTNQGSFGLVQQNNTAMATTAITHAYLLVQTLLFSSCHLWLLTAFANTSYITICLVPS